MDAHADDPVERDRELERLDALAAGALAGTGGAALVLGDAGLGKTSVLEAARRRMAAAGLRTLRARGTELEQPQAYGVAAQLLGRAVHDAGDAGLWEGAAAHARPIFRAGETAGSTGDVAFARRQGLYWLVADLVERGGPMALLIDDAQWADEPTVEFLLHLSLRLDGLAVAVVVATRPMDTVADHAALHELARDRQIGRLELAPLSPGWVGDVVAQTWGTAGPGFCAAVHAATGGNPLLVTELVEELRARADGAAPPADAPQLGDVGVRAIAERLRRDLSRDTPHALALARALAVLGEDGDVEDAVQLAGLDEAQAQEAFDGLLARRVLSDDGVRFTHPVVRTSVVAALGQLERRTLHRRAAELLHRRRPADGRIAVLLLDAAPLGEAWALDALCAAADRALELGAPAAAARFLLRALHEPGAGERGVLRTLARAETQAGVGDGLEHYARVLDAEPGPGRRLALAGELAGALSMAGRTDEAFDVLDRVVAAAGDRPDDGDRAALHALALFTNSPRSADLRREHTLELERRWPWVPADPGARSLAAVLAYERTIRAGPAAGALDAATAAFGGEGFPAELAASPSFGYGIWALLLTGRHGDALVELDRVGAAARASGAAVVAALTDCLRAAAHLRAGNLLAAEADATQSLVLTDQPSWGFGRVACTLFLVPALLGQGRVADARAAHDAVPASLLTVRNNVTDLFRQVRATLLLAEGRHPEALAEALAAGEELDRWGWTSPAFATWRGTAVRALAAMGGHDRALALAHEEVALARATAVPATIAPSLLTLGVCGPSLDAAVLAEAAGLAAGAGTRLVEAHALVGLGRAQRIAGGRTGARETLRAGLALAHRCGALGLADDAMGELAQAGARPRRAQVEGVEALTASEDRVARLAASGSTNRQIAQELYVAQKTVEMHLRNAYRKLGVPGRAHLARALAAD